MTASNTVLLSSPSVEAASIFAAIDIGSNSFHLIIARLEHGELRPIEVLAEKVQLGKNLSDHQLHPDSIARGLACLERFQQLIERVKPDQLRAVGTNALRQAWNRHEFTDPAEDILGTPVDVIYGHEEARLVYLGVAHTLADDQLERLVIDIGGGSTEFIIGRRFETKRLESLQLGCVSYSDAFFPDGSITKENFKRAYDRARVEVSHIRRNFKKGRWEEAVGSSGTLQAIEHLAIAEGWSDEGINHRSLKELRKKLIKFQHVDAIDLEGLSDRRKSVITAGVAIALAIFDGLDIDTLRTSSGALREGVIYDLLGRLSHEDVRERTVQAMLTRYHADHEVADLVAHYARHLGESVAKPWKLTENDIDLLAWSGRLHEIGVGIAQKHYNRHSAYLIENSDLPGFSQGDQELMSRLLRGHRGKIPDRLFDHLPPKKREKAARMVVLLRLAVILKHAPAFDVVEHFKANAKKHRLKLAFPDLWRYDNPLTIWEIVESKASFKKLGVKLELTRGSTPS